MKTESIPRASQRQLASWRKLLTKKGRRESGQLLLEGARLVAEAILSHSDVRQVIIADNEHGRAAWYKLSKLVRRGDIKVLAAPQREFDRLTDTVHAAGIACVVHWTPQTFDIRETTKLDRVLVCDRVSDPGNVGTLVRTAAGLGLDAVILLKDTAKLENPKTVRSAAGAIFHIPVYEDVDVRSVISWSESARVPLVVAEAHGGRAMIEGKVPARWALVIGGETLPPNPAWQHAGVLRVSLPLKRGIESLNSAVAGAIIMDRMCRT